MLALYLCVDIPAKHPLIPSGRAEGYSPLPGFGAARPGMQKRVLKKTFFFKSRGLLAPCLTAGTSSHSD
jgi:hypothetical protein